MAAKGAHVETVDAVAAFRADLVEFRRVLLATAESLTIEVHRAVEWIDRDRQPYWLRQLKLAERRLTEAQANYSRCMSRPRGEEAQSCFSERKILERCRQRRSLVEERLRALARWRIELDREAERFLIHVRRLAVLADDEVPRAVLALERIQRYLTKYVSRSSGAAEAEST